jgi:sugar/nucleoside kinase (ribokinase family)
LEREKPGRLSGRSRGGAMAQNRSAIVAGHICLDIIPSISGGTADEGKAMLLPGHLTAVGEATLSTGGPTSNTGLSLHKLGIPTKLMGKTGDDLFGSAILELLSATDESLAKGMIVDPGVETSYTVVINPPGIDRILFHCPGANDEFTSEDIDYDLVADAGLFHFGYPPLMKLMYSDGGEQLSGIYRRVKEQSVTTSLDMALPDPNSSSGRADWKKILGKTLPYVDIFLPSVEEILFMLRKDAYTSLNIASEGTLFLSKLQPELLSDLSREILEMGTRIVCLKLGDRGFYLRTADEAAMRSLGSAAPADPASWADKEIWAPCFRVDVVGTAGSGDATIAGFLSGFLRDLPPEKAAVAAVAVGACNVEKADTLSGVRSWEDTMQRIASGWEMHDMRLDSSGWVYDSRQRVWYCPRQALGP